MKGLFKTLMICLVILPGISQGQDYEMSPSGSVSELTISIENLYAELDIYGSDEKAIKISAHDYEGIPEKAKGLMPLSASGPENTGIGLSVNQEGNTVKISGAHRKADEGRYRIQIPRQARLYVEYNSFHNADGIRFSDLNGEVEVESKIGDLYFENVTGPVVASTLSSDIDLVVSELNQDSPTALSSTSGDIDLTIPVSTKGDFELKSVSGEVYTDMDFEFGEDDRLKRWGGGMSAEATLNGGGVRVSIRCVSGDIFIRKQ